MPVIRKLLDFLSITFTKKATSTASTSSFLLTLILKVSNVFIIYIKLVSLNTNKKLI